MIVNFALRKMQVRDLVWYQERAESYRRLNEMLVRYQDDFSKALAMHEDEIFMKNLT